MNSIFKSGGVASNTSPPALPNDQSFKRAEKPVVPLTTLALASLETAGFAARERRRGLREKIPPSQNPVLGESRQLSFTREIIEKTIQDLEGQPLDILPKQQIQGKLTKDGISHTVQSKLPLSRKPTDPIKNVNDYLGTSKNQVTALGELQKSGRFQLPTGEILVLHKEGENLGKIYLKLSPLGSSVKITSADKFIGVVVRPKDKNQATTNFTYIPLTEPIDKRVLTSSIIQDLTGHEIGNFEALIRQAASKHWSKLQTKQHKVNQLTSSIHDLENNALPIGRDRIRLSKETLEKVMQEVKKSTQERDKLKEKIFGKVRKDYQVYIKKNPSQKSKNLSPDELDFAIQLILQNPNFIR